MLRRFADARLRSDLDKTRDARDQARDTARRLFARLKATRHALDTQAQITERWRGIARDAQDQLAAERARTAAALAHDPMPGFPCGNPNCPCQVAAAAAIDAAERARTQETQP